MTGIFQELAGEDGGTISGLFFIAAMLRTVTVYPAG
jgi:hypothetical protein